MTRYNQKMNLATLENEIKNLKFSGQFERKVFCRNSSALIHNKTRK